MIDVPAAYRSADLQGGTPLRMVVLLYDQAIQDLRRAVKAIESNNIELRTNEINHALTVIGQLQGTLSKERGGTVAHNLERFYRLLQKKLVEAQVAASKDILNEQISCLLMVREAWTEVERSEVAHPASPLPQPPSPAAPSSEPAHADWKV